MVFLCFSVSFLRPDLLAGPVPVLGCLTVKWVWASARKKAFDCRSRQAKRSACPTQGWANTPIGGMRFSEGLPLFALREGIKSDFFLLLFLLLASSRKVAQICPTVLAGVCSYRFRQGCTQRRTESSRTQSNSQAFPCYHSSC